MLTLALDISSYAGYALLEKVNGKVEILDTGIVFNANKVSWYGGYPFSYLKASQDMADKLFAVVEMVAARGVEYCIVVEETNGGSKSSRYTQKYLEFMHGLLLHRLYNNPLTKKTPITYISSAIWRKTLGLYMSAADKKNNKILADAEKAAAKKKTKVDKKTLGVKGRINKKHLAIRYVNERFGLQLKMKDNDIADAICLGCAAIEGAAICDGIY